MILDSCLFCLPFSYVAFALWKADSWGHRFKHVVILVLWGIDLEGKYENGALQLLAEKVDVAIEFHNDLLGDVESQPHLISVKKVDVVVLLLRQKVGATLGLQNLVYWFLVLLLYTNASVHHYKYYLGRLFVEIDEDSHFAVVIRVDHWVFDNIDGHLLEPLGVSKHQSWKPLVLMRFLD